jgi:hypothetical protein
MGYEPADDVAETQVAEPETVLTDDEMDLLADLVDASEVEARTGAADS